MLTWMKRSMWSPPKAMSIIMCKGKDYSCYYERLCMGQSKHRDFGESGIVPSWKNLGSKQLYMMSVCS